MRPRKMLWQLYPPYLIVTALSLLVLAVWSAHSLRQFFLEHTAHSLRVGADFFESQALSLLERGDTAGVDSLCKVYGRMSQTRFTLVLPSGRVIGDSDEDPARMNNHSDRPEVATALAGEVGRTLRYSHTLEKDMMYLALPVLSGGRVEAVIRTATPVLSINKALRGLYWQIALAGLLVLAIMFAVNLWVFRRISQPLEELRRGAEMFARGELDRRLPVGRSREVGDLAETMNRMSSMLSERIATITSQRNELESLLAAMNEGVIVVDQEERVNRINRAAGRLFGVRPEDAPGRSIQELIRNSDLQRFIGSTLSQGSPAEGEVAIHIGETRYLQASATFLQPESKREVLIVLNDVTRTRQLENIRREFVSNVSHELKTPITSIKGFVETLMGGAKNDPADLERFLGIILKHTDRLNAIIEDILELSRIEQEGERREIDLEALRLKPVLNAAIQACRPKAESRRLSVDLECPSELEVRMNPHLLEMAVSNLLDNAIKYSPEGGKVELAAAADSERVTIRVRDHGPGIEKQHQPRLFERFYRVDKARSRHLGGTGLGLSIVKHIAQVHQGSVEVESEPGAGSTFFIHLPLPGK
ncbi:HAMP domain-containing protein [bacterium]|nr:HAMP domain-containing protein [bacterium]